MNLQLLFKFWFHTITRFYSDFSIAIATSLKGAKTEIALGILAYNFLRAINLMTPRRLVVALG